jgi:hypothetical protein
MYDYLHLHLLSRTVCGQMCFTPLGDTSNSTMGVHFNCKLKAYLLGDCRALGGNRDSIENAPQRLCYRTIEGTHSSHFLTKILQQWQTA